MDQDTESRHDLDEDPLSTIDSSKEPETAKQQVELAPANVVEKREKRIIKVKKFADANLTSISSRFYTNRRRPNRSHKKSHQKQLSPSSSSSPSSSASSASSLSTSSASAGSPKSSAKSTSNHFSTSFNYWLNRRKKNDRKKNLIRLTFNSAKTSERNVIQSDKLVTTRSSFNEFRKSKSNDLEMANNNSSNSPSSLFRSSSDLNNSENNYYDINNNSNSGSSKDRTGPRVKHVSRYPITYLNQVDNLIVNNTPVAKSFEKKYYHELKFINQDLSTNGNRLQINWQSFTSDLENNFTLSALPDRLKEKLIEKYTTSNSNNANANDSTLRLDHSDAANLNQTDSTLLNASFNNSLSSSVANNELNSSSSNLKRLFSASKASIFKRNLSHSQSENTPENSSSAAGAKSATSNVIQFDWEDYFDKNHRISSNQNFRFSSLNDSTNGTFQSNDDQAQTGSSCSNTSKLAKRFTSKLNSYKDQNQPFFGLDNKLGDLFKDATTSGCLTAGNGLLPVASSNSQSSINRTNSLNLSSSLSTSNLLFKSSDINRNSDLLSTNYIWDANIVNKYEDLSEQGYSIFSNKPFYLKSICFLCASGAEKGEQLLYCSMCCQPYHEFCLDEGAQKPTKDVNSYLNWVCPSCKYCELCFLPQNLLQCDRCEDGFHPECLKKTYYPVKHSKNVKKWLCRRCFECQICGSKNMLYEKKTFNKMTNYDFNTCFKCYDKYRLEKPLKCCSTYLPSTLAKTDIEKNLFQCVKCFSWIHYSCLQMSAQDTDILKHSTKLLSSLECHYCDGSLATIKQKLNQIREIIFKEIFCHMHSDQASIESRLISYWDENHANLNDDLCALIINFYGYLISELTEIEQLKIKDNLTEAIHAKYPFLKCYITDLFKKSFDESTTFDDELNTSANRMDVDSADITSKTDLVEQSIKQENLDNNDNADRKNRLYEKYQHALVKAPYDDHSYAMSNRQVDLIFTSDDALVQNLLQNDDDAQKLESALPNEEYANMKLFYSKMVLKCVEARKDGCRANVFVNYDESVKEDARECCLCHGLGDHELCGRLLPFDSQWIHVNCLICSDGVQIDEYTHSIQQLPAHLTANPATNKQKNLCAYCQRDGATLSCQHSSCTEQYHLRCVYDCAKCYLSHKPPPSVNVKQHPKSTFVYFYCKSHTTANMLISSSSNEPIQQYLAKIKHQRLGVDLKDELNRKVRLMGKTSSPRVQNGSFQLVALGDLDTTCDFKDYLAPLKYTSTRLFWSTRHVNRKVTYTCRILNMAELKSTRLDDYQKLIADKFVLRLEVDTDLDDSTEQDEPPSSAPFFQLDGQDDTPNESLFKSAPSLKPPVLVATQPTHGKGVIRIANGGIGATSGAIKFVHKIATIPSQSPVIAKDPTTTFKKLNNQILLNNLNQFNHRESTVSVKPPTLTLASSNTDKPKVLKIDHPLKFPTIKTSIGPKPNPPPGSVLNLNVNDLLHLRNLSQPTGGQHEAFNLNMVSPKSDKSDSSLNLNHSSLINPLNLPLDCSPFNSMFGSEKSSYESSSMDEAMKSGSIVKPQSNKTQPKPSKIPKAKKPKRNEGEVVGGKSNKCTVAALLSVFDRDKPVEPASESTADQTAQPPAETQPVDESVKPAVAPNRPIVVAKKKSNTVKKSINKLRYYFSENDEKSASEKPKQNEDTTAATVTTIKAPPLPVSTLLLDAAAATTPASLLPPAPLPPVDFDQLVERIKKEKKEKKEKKPKEPKRLKEKKIKLTLEEKLLAKKLKRDKPEKMKKEKKVYISKKKFKLLLENKKKELTIADELKQSNSWSSSTTQHVNVSQLVYEITSDDGLQVISFDINYAWRLIFDKVRALRQENNLKNHSFKSLTGVKMFGLTLRSVLYLLEQTSSIEFCPLYRPKYNRRENRNDKWIINLNKSARTLEYTNGGENGTRRWPDRFYWLTSEYRNLNLNLSQRFDQTFFQSLKSLTSFDTCNSMKYRHLKEFSKNALLVKRSNIHGRGLFALVDLQPSQMIIEYAGEIIRNEVCNRREKYYESKGIGCYMFRIDEFEVIDATTKGNQARFINHSCDPNCISKVMLIQGQKHIVIFAQRLISRGEELTYDYKFPKEDIKINCLCKSAKCRKYLN